MSSPTITVAELRGERIDLPSGGWVQLRHPDDLRSRHRQIILEAVPDAFSAAAVHRLQRKIAEVMILGWHLPYAADAAPPAHDAAVLDEVTVRDENRINRSLKPIMDLVNPDQPDPADHENPDSPTAPVGGSTPA